jgi:hypothetical protein
MNKEYYNKLLKEEIKFLLEKKELLNDEIIAIATTFEYHSKNDNVNLDKLDIAAINEKRQQILTISELIHNIDKLFIEE